MRKGFTRKPASDDEAHGHAAEAPARAQLAPLKNYVTPSGLQRLRDEHKFLLVRERPAVTHVVAWAASNGDRSENADYQYGKRRLRQIDLDRNYISWVSPLAHALMKAGPGDSVVLHAPGGTEALDILEVRYERIP